MDDADIPAIIGLLTASLGPGPGGADRRELFEWKHLRSPFGRSLALVAETEGRPVGLRTFMRWRLRTSRAPGDIVAVRAVDTVTSSDVRRRGVFSSLTDAAVAACEDEGIALVFNTPNDKSLPVYLKMGWQEVIRWPMRLKVRRPDRLLLAAARRELTAGSSVRPPAGSALLPAAEMLERPEAEGFVAGLVTPSSGWFTPRTIDYLRWRYVRCPLPYHALVDGDPPRAMILARLRSRGRLREAVVCEALCEPGSESVLGLLLRRIASEAAVDHAVAHFGEGWPSAGALAKAGFRSIGRLSMTFTVRPVRRVTPDPLDPRSWSLSLGDLEVF